MLGSAPFLVCQILKLDEELVAFPNVFQKKIEDRRRWREYTALFDTVAPADVSHLQARLEA